MTAIKGSQKIIAIKQASTFGTAVTVGSGDRVEVESYSDSENTTELTENSIGAGVVMETDSDIGSTAPTISIDKKLFYDDAGIVAMANFFGGASITSLGSGAYAHSILVNETFNQKWLTVADLKTVGSLTEYASATVTALDLGFISNEKATMALELLANAQEFISPTNTVSDLNNTTVANTKRVIVRPTDKFHINAQAGGALSDSDCLSVVSVTVNGVRPQEFISEIRCAAGNGEPESSQGIPLGFTLVVEQKNLPNLDFYAAHQAGTEYKAAMLVSSTAIGGGNSYAFEVYFPRLKLVVPVDHSASSSGRNPSTLTFKVLKASSTPAGMLDSYPYIRIVNTKSSAYIS